MSSTFPPPTRSDRSRSLPLHRRALRAVLLILGVCALAQGAQAEIVVQDDRGHALALAHPAQRIVALSPQLVELADAAGAGRHLVASVRGADWPDSARSLPRVGDAFAINLEAVVALKPDLILAWQSGAPPRQVDALQRLGIPVYWSETDSLQAIASTVQRIGQLAGTVPTATRWTRAFDARLAAQRARYAHQPPVRVFYQVWPDPLMTVGGPQLLNQVITLCGGVNPFAALPVLAPSVSREAVIAADPQLIVAASRNRAALDAWAQYGQISAVRHRQLLLLDPRLLPRMGARVLDGVAQLCAAIEHTRQVDDQQAPAVSKR